MDVFEGSSKSEFIVNHTVVFRVGFQYLLDMFHTDIKNVLLFLTFFSKDTLIGVVQYPLFNSKA